jgi:hypothetical protein
LAAGTCVAGSDCRSCDRAGAGRCDFCNTDFILSLAAGVCRAQRIATPATLPVPGDATSVTAATCV